MTYTKVDYEREMTQKFLNSLPPEERLRGLPPKVRLHGLPADEVLNHYQPEERLAGLTEEQIRAYLEQIQGSKKN